MEKTPSIRRRRSALEKNTSGCHEALRLIIAAVALASGSCTGRGCVSDGAGAYRFSGSELQKGCMLSERGNAKVCDNMKPGNERIDVREP